MRYLLCLLFCLMAGVAQAAPAGKAYMSIIIDDLGQSSERDSRTLALPGPVTMAIMPDTPHATTFARQAHKAGKTVILHMPMDPATGPYAWHPARRSMNWPNAWTQPWPRFRMPPASTTTWAAS